MKKYLVITFSLLLLFGCERPKGFTLKKITSYYEPSDRWDAFNTLSDETLLKIFNQTYSYLGSGNHTYAFVSEDGNYVMKFFKQKHMRIQSPLLSKDRIEKRKKEREESFSSYKIAFDYLREETGLLYLHLNKTDFLKVTLMLIDQKGAPTLVNLDEMEFLIQKKGVLALQHLGALIDQGAYDETLAHVRSLLNVVAKRNQMGIYDKDLQFYKNFGFLDNKAIEIDIGEFKLDVEVPNTYEELQRLTYQISEFIREKSPEFAPILEDEMNKEINRFQ
ncbi:MAG: hypothetical protein KFB93_05330 [Simkaniaceae bacterium]|nr:MAG: hypothetical protein KFB93_05330 [Simkaniaceae bacterium]